MFYKLAFNNVKKSIRDYAVYFLTLTFGICIFYVFNSIESQQVMLDISKSQRQILKSLTELIAFVSVFISIILGFLIIYANKFLIKRRKKELGLYMTLGMEKGKISKILILETLIIGIVSLAVGLIVGIFLSHGFSVITAKLFAVNLSEFAFIFSKQAFFKSLIYFGVIYLVVMVFNTVMISKYKLIDLIYAGKHNESIKIKKLWVSVLLFIVSVICLAVSYWAIIDNGLMSVDAQFYSAFIFCFIGTFLFFFSLSGFLLRVVQTNKNLYFKNLNMFVLRQLNSKINTTFISMTFICLMLAVTIVALCSGMAISDSVTKQLEENTPFDVTMVRYAGGDEPIDTVSIAKRLKEDGISFDQIMKEYIETKCYKSDIQYGEIIKKEDLDQTISKYFAFIKDQTIPLMTLSDFNTTLKLQGLEPISMEDKQYAILSNVSNVLPVYKKFLEGSDHINIYGNQLTALSNDVMNVNTQNVPMRYDYGTLIVPDYVVQNQIINIMMLNAIYNNADGSDEELLTHELEQIYGTQEEQPFHMLMTKQLIYESSKGLSTMMTYLTIYIGIVFLITSAAVIALQQLSETSDNMERYALLSKLGTEEKMINSTLFTQIFIYFMLPLSLAIVHSIIGILVAAGIIKQLGQMDILTNIVMTAVMFILVYGGYFAATYLSSRNMIRPKKS
ncbi:FtsX-like permease family protein [Oscillospiraceae bacterium PP1C4]